MDSSVNTKVIMAARLPKMKKGDRRVDEEEKMFRVIGNALILLAALNVITLIVSIIALFASMQ